MGNAYDPFFDDEDTADDNNYCYHGTFIGNPCGGDFLCGWCEDGISNEDYDLYCASQAARAKRRHLAQTFLNSVLSDPVYIGLNNCPQGLLSQPIGVLVALNRHIT